MEKETIKSLDSIAQNLKDLQRRGGILRNLCPAQQTLRLTAWICQFKFIRQFK